MKSFTFRGVEYTVTGRVSRDPMRDQGSDGIRIKRADGRPIRGAKMCPGMVQVGLSKTLERLAKDAMLSDKD